MKRKFKREILSALTITTVLVGGAVLGVAAPANAAESDCPKGYACIWRDTLWQTGGNGKGLVKFERYIPNYGAHSYASVGGGANDSASSVMNNGNSERVRFFEHATQGGAFIQLSKTTSDGNIHDAAGIVNKVFADRISSGYFEYCWNKSCW